MFQADYLPGTRSPSKGFDKTIPVSVMPYLSSNLCPVISCHRLNIGVGRGADPHTISLKQIKDLKKKSFHFQLVSMCKIVHKPHFRAADIINILLDLVIFAKKLVEFVDEFHVDRRNSHVHIDSFRIGHVNSQQLTPHI